MTHYSFTRNEGGQLVRAAGYIRERISRRSLAFDESIHCTPKGPPDKIVEPTSESRRFDIRVVNKETETSVTVRSPESESLPVQPDAVPQQPEIRRASELSSEHSEPILWLPGPVLDEASTNHPSPIPSETGLENSLGELVANRRMQQYPIDDVILTSPI